MGEWRWSVQSAHAILFAVTLEVWDLIHEIRMIDAQGPVDASVRASPVAADT